MSLLDLIVRLLRKPETHDFSGSNRHWGHDCTYSRIDGGKRLEVMGWGRGLQPGDFLILDNGPQETTCYRICTVRYYYDPPDMWEAVATFAPRAARAVAKEEEK